MDILKLFSRSNRREDGRKVRYAVLGAGWIAQEDFLPGIAHTGNSELTGIITGDSHKAAVLAEKYDAKHVWDYEQLPEALRSGVFDAIYLATPNSRHREFAVPALEVGIHVLLEKPMAPTEDDCHAIIAASDRSEAKLMIAYRLHFDEATLSSIQALREGAIGELRLFSSVFGQQVVAENSRMDGELWAGPLPDMGAYPINAARNFFGEEPIEAFAFADSLPELRFAKVDEMMTVLLRFPGNRLAQFVVSYGLNPVSEFRIAGSKGDLRMDPAYSYDKPIERWITTGEGTEHQKFPQRDQFGGETRYFSDCILDNRVPEPSGHEGFADVRVMKAIEASLRTHAPVSLAAAPKQTSPALHQTEKLSAVAPGQLVHAAPPEGA
jgi:predicted dehydrogenase